MLYELETLFFSLQSYVREEIFQTMAVIFKRGILDENSMAKHKIFDEVTQLIATGDISMVTQLKIL